MSEQVVQYIDRAMIGRRIEVGVYDDNEQVVFTAFGRLQTIENDRQTNMIRVYFEGDRNTPTMKFSRDVEYLITWDPEERD